MSVCPKDYQSNAATSPLLKQLIVATCAHPRALSRDSELKPCALRLSLAIKCKTSVLLPLYLYCEVLLVTYIRQIAGVPAGYGA